MPDEIGARSDDVHAAALLIAAAEAVLRERRRDIPQGFVAGLFGHAVPEDLVRYDGREIATLAESAWSLLAERTGGEPKIRIETPAASAGGQLRTVSVLEIVNDDMPFLLDSILAELTDLGVEVRLVVHPVFSVMRDSAGRLFGFEGDKAIPAAIRESFVHIHLERLVDDEHRDAVIASLQSVLAEVRVAVRDWRAMLTSVGAVAAELKSSPPPLPEDEVRETIAFVDWLLADNFTFLGVRNYVFDSAQDVLQPQVETGLGVLRAPDARVLRRGTQLVAMSAETRAFLMEPRLLIVTKSAVRSKVHRRVHMDYIGIKRFDAQGKLVGEFRIVGLFTSTVYTRSTRSIPYLRRKVDGIVRRAGFDPDGHSGKALVNVLETYSRDELFQVDDETLFQFAMLIQQLDARPRVRVLPRRDKFDRFVSILVFVPRERYDSDVRRVIGDYLASIYQGRVSAFYPFFPDGPLVRVHFIIGRYEGETPDPDRATLEAAVSGIVRSWNDGLASALVAAHGTPRGRGLMARYHDAFSGGYRDAYAAAAAVEDIRVIEGLTPERPYSADFHERTHDEEPCIALKVWSFGRPLPLSDRVPVLEHMGFRVIDEHTHQVRPDGDEGADVWLHDMVLQRATNGEAFDLAAAKQRLQTAFLVVMTGGAENDGYNALVLAGALGWRDVALLRAISRFLRQIRVPFSQDYLWATLTKHAHLAAQVVQLFHLRFDPRLEPLPETRASRQEEVAAAIETALGEVSSLDEDRILRHFVNAVRSALRTSYFQLDAQGQPRPRSPSNTTAASSTACRCRSRSTRCSSIRRGWKAYTCGSARWRAAVSAGRTGRRTSGPRCSGW